MKIHFKRNIIHKDKTTTLNSVSNAVKNNVRDGIPDSIAMSEIFETAKLSKLITEFIHKDINTLSITPISYQKQPLQQTYKQEIFGNIINEFEYQIEYEIVSEIYECLQFFSETSLLLVDPKTNRIFKFEKPHSVEIFRLQS